VLVVVVIVMIVLVLDMVVIVLEGTAGALVGIALLVALSLDGIGAALPGGGYELRFVVDEGLLSLDEF